MISNPSSKSVAAKTGGIFIAAGDIIALIASFFFSGLLIDYLLGTSFTETISSLKYISPFERYYLYSAASIAVLCVFMAHGHYSQRIPWWNQVRLMSVAVIFAVLAEGFASFVLDIHTSAPLIVLNWVLCFVLFIAFRLSFFRVRKNLTGWNVPTIVIGDTSTVADILYAFNADTGTGYDVHTVLLREQTADKFHAEDLPRRYSQLKIEYDIDSYEDYIRSHPDNFYVIVLDNFRGITRDKIVETLNDVNARYAIVPSTSRMSLYEMEPRYFFGFDVMLLLVKTSLSHPLSRFGKRMLDVSISFTALLFFSPLFIIILAALKLEGHEGTIFYGGERIGQNNKLFKCWKFRTMSPNSDHLLHEYLNRDADAKAHWEKYFKLPKDPRVKTRTAALLRKSSLDEIPQLWNALKGDMSIVGPRPILPNEADAYGDTIHKYIQVKPGITGLWQVSGRNSVSFQRRVYWDNWYVRNWSIWGDIVIILKTIPAVISRNDGH